MKISSFFKFVEIRTKVASVVPFLLGSVYVYYAFGEFRWFNFALMFVSLITFDMTATAVNNYIDYRKARKQEGYNYEYHNAIVRDQLSESTVRAIIFTLLTIAIVFGILLYLNTDVVVLVLGIISFIIGILYSFGPIPISRMPLGEIFSGFFMGFIIVLLAVYIHIFEREIIGILVSNGFLELSLQIRQLLILFFVSLPAVLGIANIMLANNICDIEDDLENWRFTLPIYLGKEKSLRIFEILYHLIYVDLIVLILLEVLPLVSSLVMLTWFPVKGNLRKFREQQSKKGTFALSVKNFLMINLVYILTLGLAIFLGEFADQLLQVF